MEAMKTDKKRQSYPKGGNSNNINVERGRESSSNLTMGILRHILLLLCSILFVGYFVMPMETFIAFARIVATALYVFIAWKLTLMKLPLVPDVASIYAEVDSRDTALSLSDIFGLCVYGSFAVFTLVRTTKYYSAEINDTNELSVYSYVALFLCQSLGGILAMGTVHLLAVPGQVRVIIGHVYITIISIVFSFVVLSAWVTLDKQAPTNVLVFYNCVTVAYIIYAHLLSLFAHYWPYAVIFLFNTVVARPILCVLMCRDRICGYGMDANSAHDQLSVNMATKLAHKLDQYVQNHFPENESYMEIRKKYLYGWSEYAYTVLPIARDEDRL
jgi:hypothetical protein